MSTRGIRMDDFKKLTDVLLGAYSVADLAAALGVERQHAKQMRLDPTNKGRRPPPADWRERLRPLATRVRADLRPFADPD